MPWHKGLPQAMNRVTGKYYGGNNLLILWDECLKKNYSKNEWATMRQWNRIGAGVQRGSKGTLIKFFVPVNEEEDQEQQTELEFADNDSQDDENGFKVFFNYVFNADQVTNYDIDQIEIFDHPIGKKDLIEEFISKTGATIIHEGNRAFYRVSADIITMPPKAAFKAINGSSSMENYYSVLLHELIHWTGHQSRCNRSMINAFGSPRYAFEELIAEIGTAIISTQFQNTVVPRENHAQYVNSWLRILKHDFKFFTDALELARTAVNWLYNETKILPYDLKEQFSRALNEEKVKAMDDYLPVIKNDEILRNLLNNWDSISDKTKVKIAKLMKKDVKGSPQNFFFKRR